MAKKIVFSIRLDGQVIKMIEDSGVKNLPEKIETFLFILAQAANDGQSETLKRLKNIHEKGVKK